MGNYFNINLEFNHSVLLNKINGYIDASQKGYVCVVDANILALTRKEPTYREIINMSIVNTCDGSSIAWLAGLVHKKKFKALNGPEIFESYIEKNYRQLLLGSTETVTAKIKTTLREKNIDSSHLSFLSLPFLSVEEFNYKEIAIQINELKPEIIWVSLGAPKQEIFMSSLIPHINSGVLFGIGAAFNFYIGEIGLPKAHLGVLRFIWVSRIFREPRKQLKRVIPYILILPKLWWEERKKVRNS